MPYSISPSRTASHTCSASEILQSQSIGLGLCTDYVHHMFAHDKTQAMYTWWEHNRSNAVFSLHQPVPALRGLSSFATNTSAYFHGISLQYVGSFSNMPLYSSSTHKTAFLSNSCPYHMSPRGLPSGEDLFPPFLLHFSVRTIPLSPLSAYLYMYPFFLITLSVANANAFKLTPMSISHVPIFFLSFP